MKLTEKLLHKLPEWKPQANKETLALQDAETGWKVRLKAKCVDVIGGQFWEINLKREQAVANLRDWAEGLAKRVTGLLEPLTLVEVDDSQGVALLRSESPQERDESLLYYEIRLTGAGMASVQRFQALRSGEVKRRPVVFTLTHEVVAQLVENLMIT